MFPLNFSTWKLLIGITLWKLPNGMAIDPGNSQTGPLYCLGDSVYTYNEKWNMFFIYLPMYIHTLKLATKNNI